MALFTRSFRCLLLYLWASCGLTSQLAQAQTAPVWGSAQLVGATTSFPTAAVDAAGNTYMAGYFNGTTTVGGIPLTSQGNSDAYLAKFTPAGTLAWVQSISSAGYEIASRVTLDAAGNVYVVGTFSTSITLSPTVSLTSAGNSKLFVVRYSPQGVPDWAQQSVTSADGNGIKTDAAGHVYVVGTFQRNFTCATTTLNVPASYAPTAMFLLRLSAATGSFEALLPVSYYLSNGTTNAQYSGPGLVVAPTGEAYVLQEFVERPVIGNTTFTSQGANDLLVIKYNAQGTLDWVQQIGGPSTEALNDGVVDSAGSLYLTGSFIGPTTFGTTTLTSRGGHDSFLLKYSPQGVVQWVQTSGGPAYDGWYGISLDRAGNPYVVGDFGGVAQFGTTTFTTLGSIDIAVAAYTPQGQVRWAQQVAGAAVKHGQTISLDASGNAYVVGYTRGSCTFGALTLTPTLLSSTVFSENFLARLNNATLATAAAQPQQTGTYPNPTTDMVQLANLPVGSRMQLLDVVGRVVRETTAAQLSVRGLAPGLYTVRATDALERVYVGKVVVE